jgi:predicted nucleotidyltransferase
VDKKAVLKVLRRFRQALEGQGIRVARMVLYGSWAGGRPREGSDIDVVVISEDFAGKTFWERVVILADAVYEVFEPIKAVAMTPAEWESGDSMIIEYARNGQLV